MKIINKNLKSFLSDSIIYTSVKLVSKVVPFVFLPLILKLVSPSDYGVYSLFLVTESLLIPFIGLNIHGSITRHYYERDKIDYSSYLFTVIIFQVLFSLLFIFLSLLIPDSIFPVFGFSKPIVILLMVSVGASAIINNVMTLFRVKRKPFRYGVFVFLKTLLLFTLMLGFIYINPNYEMLISGRVLANAIFFIIGLVVIYSFIKNRNYVFNVELLKYALKYSLPLIPHSLSSFIFVFSDRYLIEYFMDLESVGYYSAIFQVASLISILAISFNTAWVPWLFENLKKKDKEINLFIIKISYLCMIGFILAGGVFAMIIPFLGNIMLTSEYLNFMKIGYYFILGFVFQGIYMIINPYISYVEKTKYQSYFSMLVAVINIVLNILLIPKLGLIGAAISTTVAWGLLLILTFTMSIKLYKMPWLYWVK